MLSGVLEQIAAVTSVETAENIAKTYGGTRVYIPKNPDTSHPFVKLIGMDNVQQIVKHIGHGDFAIPTGHYRGAKAKAKLIRRLINQGYSVRDIALMADCCERTVWYHKHKLEKTFQSRQLKLPF